jgi:hypothetical protein
MVVPGKGRNVGEGNLHQLPVREEKVRRGAAKLFYFLHAPARKLSFSAGVNNGCARF